MRFVLLFVAAVMCSAVVSPSISMAASYPWCAHYGFDLDGTNCGFASFEQCRAAISGNGGFCAQNQLYQPNPNQPAPRRYRRSG